ncbi:isoprenylcysteine carboxylmethyltransferase family protein [Photobacterium sp. NCIMB 13483]|uniref:methyltransferase family protein n=1 Tax=Photobacterium sp. NCIMB 13483 TaxID=2022103 RepID=UPI0011B26905|nr:isoprenylcysteine carboxylmethyltransferase family protein [Photobacterium sp. NCIMB 13483]
MKIPPPIFVVIALLAIYGCKLFLPLWQFKTLWIIVIPLIIIMMTIGFSSVLALSKADTTISPFTPEKTTRLVTRGIYQYSRNPMYLSLLLLLIVAVFISGELSSFFVVITFVLVINHYQIKPEEKALMHLFGDEYRNYYLHVRRWL